MAHPLHSLIEQALEEARRNGEFDDLPGRGKPLTNLDEPKDAVLKRVMENANAKPPAVSLNQQIRASYERLKTLTDENERRIELKALSELQTRLSIELEAHRKYG